MGAAFAAPFVSFAEQPVHVLRNTNFYLAGRGTELESGDIIDSGNGDVLVDCGPGCVLALAPASQFEISWGAKGVSLVPLSGWFKVQSHAASAAAPVAIRVGEMRAEAADASLVVHVHAGTAELFVETGDVPIDEAGGRLPPRRTKLKSEQYGQYTPGEPLKFFTRPPKPFIHSLPPVFMDALKPVKMQGKSTPAKPDRAADFAEVAPWVADEPALRDTIDRRFRGTERRSASTARPAAAPHSIADKKLREQELARIRMALEAQTSTPAAESKQAEPKPDPAPEAESPPPPSPPQGQ